MLYAFFVSVDLSLSDENIFKSVIHWQKFEEILRCAQTNRGYLRGRNTVKLLVPLSLPA